MQTKSLQILIPDGNPNGLKVVTLPGWSGRCYVVPRQSVKALKEQPGTSKPGLYILFGQDDGTGEQLAYIGESENFFDRITSHNASKDFWDTALVFTGELNRAYVKYLEHRATLLASEAKRRHMQNKVQPGENNLSDYDKVAVEQYFQEVQFVMSALNYDIFERVEVSLAGGTLYYLKLKDVDATARLLGDGSMQVLAGSFASIHEAPSYQGWTKEERKKYVAQGTFTLQGERYQLTEDIVFKSPSAAAATMAARSINGWTAWKDDNGRTLDENLR